MELFCLRLIRVERTCFIIGDGVGCTLGGGASCTLRGVAVGYIGTTVEGKGAASFGSL